MGIICPLWIRFMILFNQRPVLRSFGLSASMRVHDHGWLPLKVRQHNPIQVRLYGEKPHASPAWETCFLDAGLDPWSQACRWSCLFEKYPHFSYSVWNCEIHSNFSEYAWKSLRISEMEDIQRQFCYDCIGKEALTAIRFRKFLEHSIQFGKRLPSINIRNQWF
jgi:hypothetical protein